VLDSDELTAEWEADLNAPECHGSPVWIHGDIQAGNLLVNDGRLSAVIDFGGLAVGDHASDLIVAWNLLTTETRNVFREGFRSTTRPGLGVVAGRSPLA
jgi:aminoglycoside phosphotransferase (APT) family kinase protein